MNREERWFLVFLLAVAVAMTAMSLRFSSGSRMLPLMAGLFATVVLAFLVVASYAPALAEWYRRMDAKARLVAAPLTREERKREIAVTAWFIGALLLVYVLGFMVAIPLFLFLFLKVHAREGWVISLSIPAGVTAVVYVSFIFILRVPLYEGPFF